MKNYFEGFWGVRATIDRFKWVRVDKPQDYGGDLHNTYSLMGMEGTFPVTLITIYEAKDRNWYIVIYLGKNSTGTDIGNATTLDEAKAICGPAVERFFKEAAAALQSKIGKVS